MERLYSNIVGTPVLEDDALRPMAIVRDIVVDPLNGLLLAVIVNSKKTQIISAIDIAGWTNVVHIHNRHVIVDAGDVLRISEILKNGFHIFRNRVESENGEYLGKVFDFTIDEVTMCLNKLFIAKEFLGIFRYDNRIMHAKNILAILPDKIIVKNPLKTVKEEAKSAIKAEDAAAI